jgi:hypothetical protein
MTKTCTIGKRCGAAVISKQGKRSYIRTSHIPRRCDEGKGVQNDKKTCQMKKELRRRRRTISKTPKK